MYKNTRLPTKVVTDIRSDELFSDNDDPVLLNMSVTYTSNTNVQHMKLNTTDVNEMKNAFFACGLPKLFNKVANRSEIVA